jgi:hypothetical protein
LDNNEKHRVPPREREQFRPPERIHCRVLNPLTDMDAIETGGGVYEFEVNEQVLLSRAIAPRV